MTKKKLVLVDGNSLAYRAFFALPPLTNDEGMHTQAIYGFTMMLQMIIEEEQPTHFLVAWDAGKQTFRHEKFQEYKGGRQKTPPELSEQFPFVRQLIEAYQIMQYELPQYEADDIIGTLSQLATDDLKVVIVSGDKDLTQLANEHVTVRITRKGITDTEDYTPEHIKEKYGLTPSQIIEMKGLMGDKSDNIPGVPGIGEKTAIKLLKEYQTIEGIYEAIDAITAKKLNENLRENEEIAFLSRDLATIDCHSPLTIAEEDLQFKEMNKEAVIALYEKLNFTTLLDKMDRPLEEVSTPTIESRVVEKLEEHMLTSPMSLHFEMMDDNYLRADILGIGLSDGEQTYFISQEVAQKSEVFRRWLTDEKQEKYCSDAKAAYVCCHRMGIELKGVIFDLLVGAYIAGKAQSPEFASIARAFGNQQISTEEVIYGKGAKKASPEQALLVQHTGQKATVLMSLQSLVEKELQANEQFNLYQKLELPLARILAKMEVQGIRVDRAALQQIGTELAVRLKELETVIYDLAGEEFNINSPKQLGVVLFEHLGLIPIKKTKTGYSTAADVLEKLQDEHPIISNILLYRQYAKLQSTYIEGLTKEIFEDGKIHTRFQQALTTTGRLSSINPNLQNIPVRLEEGRKIRQAFIPSEQGWSLLAADYSQIELRVLAHISGDTKLIAAFEQGADIHRRTASDVFGVPIEEVTKEMRSASKAVNFGIIYGISDYGLSQNLQITRKEAAQFIDSYLASFPQVASYMKEVVEQAKQVGYVATLLNRRRYLPDLNSSNFNIRSFAERTAMNTPIQGSAADIIKEAMVKMNEQLEQKGLQTRLLLQVHDELIFEAPPEEVDQAKKLITEVMESAIELRVPLQVDVSVGDTWYTME